MAPPVRRSHVAIGLLALVVAGACQGAAAARPTSLGAQLAPGAGTSPAPNVTASPAPNATASPAPQPPPAPAAPPPPPANVTQPLPANVTASPEPVASPSPPPPPLPPPSPPPAPLPPPPPPPTLPAPAAPAPAAPAPLPAAAPAPPAPAGATPSLGGGSCPDPQAILDAHNRERATTGAAPLTWSSALATQAQGWADGCKLQPSGGGGAGENLGAGTAWQTCAAAMPLFLAGRSAWQPGGSTAAQDALSWTQIVWKGTTELGCGFAQCPGLGGLVVCAYSPPGNVAGAFGGNV